MRYLRKRIGRTRRERIRKIPKLEDATSRGSY
jgi:hypothetical protein